MAKFLFFLTLGVGQLVLAQPKYEFYHNHLNSVMELLYENQSEKSESMGTFEEAGKKVELKPNTIYLDVKYKEHSSYTPTFHALLALEQYGHDDKYNEETGKFEVRTSYMVCAGDSKQISFGSKPTSVICDCIPVVDGKVTKTVYAMRRTGAESTACKAGDVNSLLSLFQRNRE